MGRSWVFRASVEASVGYKSSRRRVEANGEERERAKGIEHGRTEGGRLKQQYIVFIRKSNQAQQSTAPDAPLFVPCLSPTTRTT